MIGETSGLINVIMMLLVAMGWALEIVFGVILVIFFGILAVMLGAVAIEQAISFALRALAKRSPTYLD